MRDPAWVGAGLALLCGIPWLLVSATPATPAAPVEADFGRVYGGVARARSEVFAFRHRPAPGQVAAVRVYVNSSSENLQYPVLFVVRQQKGVLSWQVPLLFQGLHQQTYNYQEVSRTLCPSEPANETAGTLEQLIFVDVASMAPLGARFNLLVTKIKNFQLRTNDAFFFTASPSQPQYFLYSFPEGVDTVIIKVVSEMVYPCSVVSVQDIVCPVYDLDHNVEFSGISQSMTKKAAVTVQKKDFAREQFFVVFVIKPEDYACGGPLIVPDQENRTWNLQRTKTLQVTVVPSIQESIYVKSMLLSFLVFFFFFLGALFVALGHYIRVRRQTGDGGFVSDDGSGNMVTTHPISTSTTENSSYGAIEDSSSRGGQQLSPAEGRPQRPTDTDSSVEEDSDFDTLPDIESDKNVIRTKMSLHLSDLSRKDRRIISKKYKIYFWNIITIGVFYALPVVQLVIAYQAVVNVTGNQDLCYYNFLCARPWGALSAFNNILSNVGHVLLGLLFLLIVLRRDIWHRRALGAGNIFATEYGVPKHFGLFYAMGVALMMEGLLSACYHVCPNYSNFQFDTSFMYMIAGLCMLKLYQTRHPDINANAYAAYASFAFIICLTVLGVFGKSNVWFWVIFSAIHILASLALSTQIYYMGVFKIDWGIFQRAAAVFYTDCVHQCSRPMYTDRMVLLILGNLANWSLALFGLVSRPRDFASYMLGIFICNLLLYLAFYIIMKLRNAEKLLPIPLICIVATAGLWAAALYFFFQSLSSWEETPAESREKNQDCILLDFFDAHDVWHFLSATALFFSFLVLLTLDDDLDLIHRDKIPVF
ncbi:SID1 transmembrane family member 1 isoform X1 [Ornithorhynchus anatinus]|uniref:SID1 transmembrane family member 1 n=3 Tax=Ornithorhynchus anatinus TaxID=9258 RepID=F7FZS1_ORNAN|nr:SID1 transmembrane family member 1 isoform X1 [Ornithorhynchus anatinus]